MGFRARGRRSRERSCPLKRAQTKPHGLPARPRVWGRRGSSCRRARAAGKQSRALSHTLPARAQGLEWARCSERVESRASAGSRVDLPADWDRGLSAGGTRTDLAPWDRKVVERSHVLPRDRIHTPHGRVASNRRHRCCDPPTSRTDDGGGELRGAATLRRQSSVPVWLVTRRANGRRQNATSSRAAALGAWDARSRWGTNRGAQIDLRCTADAQASPPIKLPRATGREEQSCWAKARLVRARWGSRGAQAAARLHPTALHRTAGRPVGLARPFRAKRVRHIALSGGAPSAARGIRALESMCEPSASNVGRASAMAGVARESNPDAAVPAIPCPRGVATGPRRNAAPKLAGARCCRALDPLAGGDVRLFMAPRCGGTARCRTTRPTRARRLRAWRPRAGLTALAIK